MFIIPCMDEIQNLIIAYNDEELERPELERHLVFPKERITVPVYSDGRVRNRIQERKKDL